MRCAMIKKLGFLLGLGFISTSTYASDTMGRVVSEETMRHRTLLTLSTSKVFRPVAGFWALSGSNTVPLALASKFLTGGYISPEEMKEYESKLLTQNRMGYLQNMYVSVYPFPGLTQSNNQLALKQVKVGTMSLGGISFTKDAFGIVFRGNTPYLGQRKELGSNSFMQLRQRYIDFDFTLPLKAGNWSFSTDVKLSQVLDFQRAETNNLFLESDKNADSIVLGGNFYSQQTGYDFWGTGVGFQMGFGAYRSVNGGSLSINVSDLGVLSVNGIQRQSRGYAWEQSNLKPSADLNVKDVNIQSVGLTGTDIKASNWFDRQRDSVEARLNIEEGVQRGTVLSPFVVNINYNKSLLGSKITGYRLGVNYIHMVGFTPRFSGEIQWRPIKGLSLNHGVSIGGFDTFDVNSSVSFNAGTFSGETLMWSVYVRGIESFLMPSEFHGGGVGIQVYYPFGS